MKILFACNSPLAGVTPRTARLVNKYFKGFHEARILINSVGPFECYTKGWPDSKPSKFMYNIKNEKDVQESIKWADVVHCNANVGIRMLGGSAKKFLKKKIWVFQWHGAQLWPFRTVWEKEDYKYVKWAHIGQGWIRDKFFDKFKIRILPNLVDIEDDLFTPLSWEEREDKVGFSPSTLKSGLANEKGVDEVKSACKDVTLDLINGISFDDCLRRKKTSILGIDEVVKPYYHLSGLEFLSQGTACICSYDSLAADNLREATGSATVPFLNADPDNLRELVRGVMSNKELLRSAGTESRYWMENFYHPKDILSRYLDFYRE